MTMRLYMPIGSIRNVVRLYADLRAARRDRRDDGTVRDHNFELRTRDETTGTPS